MLIIDFLYLVLSLAIMAFFSHIIAIFVLSPFIYFWCSNDSVIKRCSVLLFCTPILWYFFLYLSSYGRQYFQSPSSIGLLFGAIVSTTIILFSFEKIWFNEIKWLPWIIMIGFPVLGYFLGNLF